jgi:predicted DCC family thiol-disulfide oxidoreductase YuxK
MQTTLPVLIYDGDCGFCTRSARLVALLPVSVRLTPWQEADLPALRVSEQRARNEVIWVDPTGRVRGGAAAIAEIFRHCRAPWRPFGWLLSAPVLRILADRCYRWVAANRFRLPGSTPACQLPADQRPGAQRPQ